MSPHFFGRHRISSPDFGRQIFFVARFVAISFGQSLGRFEVLFLSPSSNIFVARFRRQILSPHIFCRQAVFIALTIQAKKALAWLGLAWRGLACPGLACYL